MSAHNVPSEGTSPLAHSAEYERLRAEANDLARRLHETTQDYVDLKEENERLRAQHADYVCPSYLDSARMFWEGNTLLFRPIRCQLRRGHDGIHRNDEYVTPCEWSDAFGAEHG